MVKFKRKNPFKGWRKLALNSVYGKLAQAVEKTSVGILYSELEWNGIEWVGRYPDELCLDRG